MSDNVRVYEIAEEAGASSNEVITKAKDLGLELKSPQTAVTFEDAEEIANYIMTGKSRKLLKQKENQKKAKNSTNIVHPSTTKNSVSSNHSKRKDLKGLKIVRKNKETNLTNKIVLNEIQQSKEELSVKKIIENDKIKIKELVEKKQQENKHNNYNIEIDVSSNKLKNNEKRTDFPLNSYPKVIIEIQNLKTINYLKWDLQEEPGVYALIGENGSGKSSLLISIAKLIEPAIFHHELTGTGYYDDTKITYTINDKKFSWIKNQSTNNNWRQSSDDKINMPNKLKGFFESSILTGTRFDKVDDYIKDELEYRSEDTITSASEFIKDAMNYILFGKRKLLYKFDNLCKINAKRKRKKSSGKTYLTKEYNYYALNLKKDEYIKEHLFSTGEYFLLQLLKFIDNFQNNSGSVIPALIIIDEVELSLHPLAQIRLTEQLKVFSKKFKLIILFASHSLHILENINAKNTFFIQKNINEHKILNPVHLGYLTSKLYKHQFYDKVILVEDELAKYYIECTLNDLAHHKNLSVGVLIVGGSNQVVKAAVENCHERFYGDADVMVSLDEDKKKDVYSQKKYVKWFHHIPVERNIEYYVDKLVKNEDYDFIEFIETILIKESYHNLIIQTTNQKTAFTTLVAEVVKNTMGRYFGNKDNAKKAIQKEIVNYIYTINKNKDEQSKLVQKIMDLFEYEK